VAARATDAASTLLDPENIDAWIVIASAIHVLIEAICFEGFPSATPTKLRTGPHSAIDPSQTSVAEALEHAVRAITSGLASRGIVVRQHEEPQQTPCDAHGDGARPRRAAPSWRPIGNVGRGQPPVGGAHDKRLAGAQNDPSPR
jgi:hypothetical protein